MIRTGPDWASTGLFELIEELVMPQAKLTLKKWSGHL
jgi:hypothetical protein